MAEGLGWRSMARTAKKAPTKKKLSDAHLEALALGREEGRAVRRYLEALESHRPKRGRKRTQDTVQRQLHEINSRLVRANALDRVQLLQRKMDLEQELAVLEAGEGIDLSELESGFVQAAKGYSERKGISYAAWREAGIEPRVLKAAGIGRSSTD
jgi:hypothetical protein